MYRLNCWEYQGCGREIGGRSVGDEGVCPAAANQRANGINAGINGGRACWAVAGTLCRGEVQGSVASKLSDCASCGFASKVREQEGARFASLEQIYRKLAINCWEHMRCGREQGGNRSRELGICPAASARAINGMHDGTNGGRACWAVAGTHCNGQVQGSFASKLETCLECEFFARVREEQKQFLVPVSKILEQLKSELASA